MKKLKSERDLDRKIRKLNDKINRMEKRQKKTKIYCSISSECAAMIMGIVGFFSLYPFVYIVLSLGLNWWWIFVYAILVVFSLPFLHYNIYESTNISVGDTILLERTLHKSGNAVKKDWRIVEVNL